MTSEIVAALRPRLEELCKQADELHASTEALERRIAQAVADVKTHAHRLVSLRTVIILFVDELDRADPPPPAGKKSKEGKG